jgi:hypothetical protein
MSRMVVVAFVGVMTLASGAALAGEQPGARCTDIAVPKTAIEAHNGKWIELTADQWQFLRGVYVLNPNTPAGMPFGDKAVLAQVSGDPGGLVFFIDGDRACTPMAIPGELIAMIKDVGTNNVNHEGGGL